MFIPCIVTSKLTSGPFPRSAVSRMKALPSLEAITAAGPVLPGKLTRIGLTAPRSKSRWSFVFQSDAKKTSFEPVDLSSVPAPRTCATSSLSVWLLLVDPRRFPVTANTPSPAEAIPAEAQIPSPLPAATHPPTAGGLAAVLTVTIRPWKPAQSPECPP